MYIVECENSSETEPRTRQENSGCTGNYRFINCLCRHIAAKPHYRLCSFHTRPSLSLCTLPIDMLGSSKQHTISLANKEQGN